MKSCVSLRPAGFWHIRRCQLLFPASVSGCCSVFKGVSWCVFNAYLDGQFSHYWEVMLLDQAAVKIFFFFFLRRIRAKSIHLFNSRVKWAKNATQPLLQSNIKRTPPCGSWFQWNGRDFKSCDHLGGANFILPGWGSRQTGVYLPGLVQHSSEGTSPDKKKRKNEYRLWNIYWMKWITEDLCFFISQIWGLSSLCCFKNHHHQVRGAPHGAEAPSSPCSRSPLTLLWIQKGREPDRLRNNKWGRFVFN